MEFNIQFVQMAPNVHAENLAIDKLEKLARKFEWILFTEVTFREEKGNAVKGHICEMQLSVPGPRIFASSGAKSSEEALTATFTDVERQLIKRKEAMKNL